MMQNATDRPLDMLIIGIAEGQEPLTHITSALEVAREKNTDISKVLDLSFIEVADRMKLPHMLKDNLKDYGDPEALRFYASIYNDDSKGHFLTPFENLVPKMRKQNIKKDVILFNNVIQHVNYGKNKADEQIIYSAIKDMIDMVKVNGVFCFTCENRPIKENPDVKKHYDYVISILEAKDSPFKKEAEGIYRRIKESKNAQVSFGHIKAKYLPLNILKK